MLIININNHEKLIITEWMSLDGIFDATSMNKWWMPFDGPARQQHIQDTINNSEIMLYGRKTYEMLYPYWSSFKTNEQGVADNLNNCKKYVVSSTLKQAPWGDTTILREDFLEQITKVKNEDGGYILVQGSATLIKPLLQAGLVDELNLLINPAIIGTGARVFSEGIDCNLQLDSAKQLDKGVLSLTYKPIN